MTIKILFLGLVLSACTSQDIAALTGKDLTCEARIDKLDAWSP